jgi:prepilin-type N-terminal cleavage/methylation domain-containing protein
VGRKQGNRGFTIVELLIVVVVIAILAAMTIISYNGIQNRAKTAALQTAASQASQKILTYAALNTDLYPADETSFLSAANLADTSDIDYVYLVSSDRSHYCVSATNQGNPSLSSAVSDTSGGTVEGRCVRNYVADPAATSLSSGASGSVGWRTTRWFGGGAPTAGSHTAINAPDGVAGLTTYIHKTWSVAPSDISRSGDTGFDLIGGGLAAFPVTPGDTWMMSCYLRASVKRNFEIGFYQYGVSGAAYSTPRIHGGEVAGQVGQWTRASYAHVIPSGVSYITVVCDSTFSTANGAVNWSPGSTLDGTALMLTRGDELYSYGDGSSPGWSWDGTPNNSTSFGPAKLQ